MLNNQHLWPLTRLAPLCGFFILLAVLFTPQTSHAKTNLVIYDVQKKYQSSFFKELQNQANNTQTRLLSIPLAGLSKEKIERYKPSLIISLDPLASKKLKNYKIKTPVIHGLLTSIQAKKIMPCLPHCSAVDGKHTFLVLDQPLARQLKLIKLIKPHTSRIGVLYAEHSLSQVEQLKKLAPSFSLKIEDYLVKPKTLKFQLNDVAQSSDIILAMADTAIYNAATLPQILLTSYRYHTPVIAFSKGFIKAGAVSGVVSNLEQLAQQLIELILFNPEHSIIYPKYFNVISNRSVAKSLSLYFPDDSNLTATLKTHEAVQ